MDRLALLHQFLEEEPGDPFNRYALALEYEKHDVQKARALYAELLKDHANYLPTYYHAGKLLASVGATIEATEVFARGMALARSTNETKALRELQNAYNEMLY